MTLVDPTAGAGYAYGEKLPLGDVNTIVNQQPNAVDGVGGGTYSGNNSFTGTHTHSNVITLVSADFNFVQPLHAATPETHTGNLWEIDNRAPLANFAWELLNDAAGRKLLIPFTSLPNQGEMKSVTCYINGGIARAGDPGAFSILSIYERPVATGVSAALASTNDVPGAFPACKGYRILGQGPLAFPAGKMIDGTMEYFAMLDSEWGGGVSANDFWVVDFIVTVTCTSIAPG
jgi:hypothetical protein